MGSLKDAAESITTFMENTSIIGLDEPKTLLRDRFFDVLNLASTHWLSDENICRHDTLKSLHAVFALIGLHKELVKPKLSRSNSNFSYGRSWVAASPGDEYYKCIRNLSESIYELIAANLPQHNRHGRIPRKETPAKDDANISPEQKAFPINAAILKIRLSAIGNMRFIAVTHHKMKQQELQKAATYSGVTLAATAAGGFLIGLLTTPFTANPTIEAYQQANQLGQGLKLNAKSQALNTQWQKHILNILNGEIDDETLLNIFAEHEGDESALIRAHLTGTQAFMRLNDITEFPELACGDCFGVREIRKEAITEILKPTPRRFSPAQ